MTALPCLISQGEGDARSTVFYPLRVIAHDARSFHPGQVRAEKAASEERVARCAADLRASLQDLSRAHETRTVGRHSAQLPPSARHLPQNDDPAGGVRGLITPLPGAEWRAEHGSRRTAHGAAPPRNSDSSWRQGSTRSRLDELDSDSD